MNAQTRQQQQAAILRRRDLYELRYKITTKRDRRGLNAHEQQMLAAVDAELETLRGIGAGPQSRQALPDRRERKRRTQKVMPREFKIVRGGLPGMGR